MNIEKIYVPTSASFFWYAQQLALSSGWQKGDVITPTKSNPKPWMIFDLYYETVNYVHKAPEDKDKSIKIANTIRDVAFYILPLPVLSKPSPVTINTFGSIDAEFDIINRALANI